jgi:hypothetical protein
MWVVAKDGGDVSPGLISGRQWKPTIGGVHRLVFPEDDQVTA